MIIAGATAYPRIIDPDAVPRRSPTRSGRCSCSTPPTSPGSSPVARTRTRCPTPTSSPSPPTRPCGAPVAAASCATAELGRGHRQGRLPGSAGRPARARHRGQGGGLPRGRRSPSSRSTPPRSCATPRPSPRRSPARASASCPAAPTTTCMLVDLRTFDAELTGKEAQAALDEAGITLNKNTIPDDPRSPFVTSGRAHRHRRRSPPRAWASRRWARSRRSSPGRCGAATTPPSWRRCATTSPRSAPSSRRTRERGRQRPCRASAPTGSSWPSSTVVTLRVHVRGAARWRSGSARWSSPTSAGCTRGPPPTLGGLGMLVGLARRHGRGVARWAPFDAGLRRQHRAARPRARRHRHRGRRRHRRPARGVAARQDRRHRAGRQHPRRSPACRCSCFRVPFLGVFVLSTRLVVPAVRCCGSSGMANAINLIDGLDGLAGGIVAIAAGAFFLYCDRLGNEGLLAPGQHRRRSSRWSPSASASASCPTTSTRRGSSWATAARSCSGC